MRSIIDYPGTNTPTCLVELFDWVWKQEVRLSINHKFRLCLFDQVACLVNLDPHLFGVVWEEEILHMGVFREASWCSETFIAAIVRTNHQHRVPGLCECGDCDHVCDMSGERS